VVAILGTMRALVLVAAMTVAAGAQPRHAKKTKHALHAKKKKRRRRIAKKLRRVTVEQQSVQLASVGRVRYADEMPPGFAWPATDDMRSAEQGCEAELVAHGLDWQRADAMGEIADPVVVPKMVFGGVVYRSGSDKPPIVLDCQLARMLARVGPSLWNLGVREVTFGSVYRNTKVRFLGHRGKALSRHALGLAMDVVSFTDDHGRVVKVTTDYPKKDPLLLAIEDLIDHDKDFRILLTPKNDPISHKDHFHLEASVDFRP
jgi:hypothetical protein